MLGRCRPTGSVEVQVEAASHPCRSGRHVEVGVDRVPVTGLGEGGVTGQRHPQVCARGLAVGGHLLGRLCVGVGQTSVLKRVHVFDVKRY